MPPHQNNTPDAPFDALENALYDALSLSDESAAGVFDDNAANVRAAVDAPTAEVPMTAARRPSGWLVGMALGVLIGLCLLPPVRYTLGSQLRFALAQDGLPWVLSLDSERTLREAPRLDATAATLPDDYLLQVGRATAFVELGGVRAAPTPKIDHPDNTVDTSDHTLIRLTRVAHDFPVAAGAQAHLARYMMVDRVRIQRAELAGQAEEKEKRRKGEKETVDTRYKIQDTSASSIENRKSKIENSSTIPARYTDVKLMRMALSNGERLDPDNVFWPAMLAATYFAAGRDTQALDALARCDRKTRWDSYIYEEILGQWRLYSLAYGDHGATQKIGPLSIIAFPHLRELRRMTEMARWHADQEAGRGNVREALQIRHHLLRLGALLRDTATWAYEALYGTDLTLIAASDNDATPRQTTVRTVAQWQQQAQGYLEFLRTNGKLSEITLLTTEVEESCKLRAQVDGAPRRCLVSGYSPRYSPDRAVRFVDDGRVSGSATAAAGGQRCGGVAPAQKRAKANAPATRNALDGVVSCQRDGSYQRFLSADRTSLLAPCHCVSDRERLPVCPYRRKYSEPMVAMAAKREGELSTVRGSHFI